MAVYFVACDFVGLVKIGVTNMPPLKRFLALSTQCPVPLRLAAYDLAGDDLTEKELHHRFRDQRQHGEWFTHTGLVAAAVEFTASERCVPDGWYITMIPNGRRASWQRLREAFSISNAEANAAAYGTAAGTWATDGVAPGSLPVLFDALRERMPGLTAADFLGAA